MRQAEDSSGRDFTALPVDGQILCFGVFEHARMAAFTPESRLFRATERSRWIRDDPGG